MANEKLQRYFAGIVKNISDACTQQVKTQLCKLDSKNFHIFYKKFNQYAEIESPTLYNLVQLFYLIEDLKIIIQLSQEMIAFFSQKLINAQIFFNTIFNSSPITQTYIETLKKLHHLEKTMNVDLLNALGKDFRLAVVNFQTTLNPTTCLLAQLKDELIRIQRAQERRVNFDPIIEYIEHALSKISPTTPISMPSIKLNTAISQ